MKIGDKVKRKINYGAEGGSLLPEEEGTVVYIHPARLYCTVEFTFEGRNGPQILRESYPLKNRQIVETAEDELPRAITNPRLPGSNRYYRPRALYLETDQAKYNRKGKKPK